MKTPNKITAEIVDMLSSLVKADEVWPVPIETIGALVAHHLQVWQTEISDELERLYRDWESRFAEDDDTLYTLGLRRAQDIVLGIDPLAQ